MPAEDREVKPTSREPNDSAAREPADHERTGRELTPEELAQQEGEIPPPKASPPTSPDMAEAPKSAETNQQD
ncbi:MAG: hypothetical protein M3069_24855 [Chloroflexota bacterium]|nr:hypothetical protein [Chloroflexota bacterium]